MKRKCLRPGHRTTEYTATMINSKTYFVLCFVVHRLNWLRFFFFKFGTYSMLVALEKCHYNLTFAWSAHTYAQVINIGLRAILDYNSNTRTFSFGRFNGKIMLFWCCTSLHFSLLKGNEMVNKNGRFRKCFGKIPCTYQVTYYSDWHHFYIASLYFDFWLCSFCN